MRVRRPRGVRVDGFQDRLRAQVLRAGEVVGDGVEGRVDALERELSILVAAGSNSAAAAPLRLLLRSLPPLLPLEPPLLARRGPRPDVGRPSVDGATHVGAARGG